MLLVFLPAPKLEVLRQPHHKIAMATGSNAPGAGGAQNGLPQHTRIGTDADPTRGLPYHEKLTADLKQALAKKKMLERTLVNSSYHKTRNHTLTYTLGSTR